MIEKNIAHSYFKVKLENWNETKFKSESEMVSYVACGYHMKTFPKKCISEHIFQVWHQFDLQWKLGTTNEIWCQSTISYVGQWYHLSMHAKNWVPECIFKIWPPFDLQWPLVTSYDFWGQNIIAYVGQGYHMIMHAKN